MSAATLERVTKEPTALRTLGRMRSSAARMTRMLDQLGDLARARLDGGIPIEPQPMDLRMLAGKIVEELSLANPERALVFHAGDGDTDGVWDEERMGQVFANLLGNALRHGTPEARVRVQLCAAEELTIEVRNGGELPPELEKHLFDPFRRGHEGPRNSLGLGLFIVRQIVAAHGGTIDAHSSHEEGVIFRVRLPPASGRARA